MPFQLSEWKILTTTLYKDLCVPVHMNIHILILYACMCNSYHI